MKKRIAPTLVGALALVVGLTSACSSGRQDAPANESAARVASCDAYAEALRRCVGDAPPAEQAASQAAALAVADPAERAAMDEVCTRELARLKVSCR